MQKVRDNNHLAALFPPHLINKSDLSINMSTGRWLDSLPPTLLPGDSKGDSCVVSRLSEAFSFHNL